MKVLNTHNIGPHVKAVRVTASVFKFCQTLFVDLIRITHSFQHNSQDHMGQLYYQNIWLQLTIICDLGQAYIIIVNIDRQSPDNHTNK